jgi:glycosyltransferase involved in cell wall biosynthesis
VKSLPYYRILMFAPAFAPFANAEAIVNSKLALGMLNADWEIDVISRKLVNLSDYDYGTAWNEPWVPLKEHTYEISYDLGNKVRRATECLWSSIRMGHPIEGCRWAAHAYDLALSLHRRNPYDVVISRAFPVAAHLPAMKMSQKTHLPWVANWNDPWPFLTKEYFSSTLVANVGLFYGRFCKLVGIKSSWLTFPSEKLRMLMCSYLGKNSIRKSTVIPHSTLPFGFPLQYKKKTVFKICYAGRLWPDQNPTLFLSALKELIEKANASGKIVFEHIGIDDVNLKRIGDELDISSSINCVGNLSYIETIRRIADSDVLLVIDPPSTNGILLTSKFVDYVETGRPILAISKKSGTAYDIITNYGGGIAVDYSSKNQIWSALHKLYIGWENNTLGENYGSSGLRRLFCPETIVKMYEEIFHSVIRENPEFL